MIFIAFLTSVFLIYIIQYKLYEKHAFDNVGYNVSLSTDEVFEDEDIFMFEEITNKKYLPLPYVKVNTELPSGLNFRLIEIEEKTSSKRDKITNNIQSMFVMKSNQKIRRRWRVTCKTRGVYTLGHVVMIANDIVGFNPQSKGFEVAVSKLTTIMVLPKAVDLENYFNTSNFFTGDMVLQRSLISDPLRKCGTRDYTSSDPLSKINWKSTASHSKLMVNIEEYTQRYQFNIIMNMQSRDIDIRADEPSTPEFVERCITIAASILDRVSSDNIPVKFITNTPPSTIAADCTAGGDDDATGSKIFLSPTYSGKRDMINALRMLAMIQMKVSVPIEKMLDHILNNPHIYASGGNILFISTYLSERMIVFSESMERLGIDVVFFITTTNANAMVIPDNIRVYFKSAFSD